MYWLFCSFLYWNSIQNKISPGNGILFNDVLRPKILNILFVSCVLVNPGFLLLYIAHFDNRIALSSLVFETLGFMLSVYFLFVFYTLNSEMTLFYIWDFKLLLIISMHLVISLVTATGIELRTTSFVNEHSTIWPN